MLRAFGFANSHAIVVGGLVPSLLVPKPDAGLEPHVGTEEFRSIDAAGAVKYARFLADDRHGPAVKLCPATVGKMA